MAAYDVSVDPIATDCSTVPHLQLTLAMLLSIQPGSLKYTAVAPIEVSFPFFSASDVLTLVPVSVWPSEYSIPVHQPSLPATAIAAIILPREVPLTPEHPALKLPFVGCPR